MKELSTKTIIIIAGILLFLLMMTGISIFAAGAIIQQSLQRQSSVNTQCFSDKDCVKNGRGNSCLHSICAFVEPLKPTDYFTTTISPSPVATPTITPTLSPSTTPTPLASNSANSACQPFNNSVAINASDNVTSVAVPCGGTLLVTVSSGSDGGYQLDPPVFDTNYLQLLNKVQVIPTGTPMLGASAEYRYTFRTLLKGTSRLQITVSRSWETGSAITVLNTIVNTQ